MKPLTLVFFHRGQSWYLKYILRQALRFNRNHRIILLSDYIDPLLQRLCEVHLFQPYRTAASELAAVFRNFSPNSHQYELFCLERWFILREFCSAKKLERVVHLDSDVMIYSDLLEAGKEFADMDMVITGFQSPASTYISSQATLSGFCEFILSEYKDNLPFLERSYQEWLSKGLAGGISDMHFLHEFVARGGWKFGNNAIVRNGSRFDDSATSHEGYAFNGETKDFKFVNGQPYCKRSGSNDPIRFHTIHFQGMSKKHIPASSTKRDLYYYSFALANRLKRHFGAGS